MIRKFVIPLLILALAAGGAYGLYKTRPVSEPIVAEENVWLVSIAIAEPGRYQPELTLYGVVESAATTQVRAALQADVTGVHIREGEQLESGHRLIELDDRDVTLIVRQREAELAQIEADMASEQVRHEANLSSLPVDREMLRLSRKAAERAKDLARKKVGSKSNLDSALQDVQRQLLSVKAREQSIREHSSRLDRLKASHLRAQVQLDQAKLDVERTHLQAPITGRVASVSVAVGDRVRNGDVLMEMYDNAALQVRAQIANRHVGEVERALRFGSLRAEAEVDGKTLSLSLSRFAGKAGDGAGVYGLFDILDGGERLPLGRFITLRMKLPDVEEVVSVPMEALYGTNRLYTVVDQRMRGVSVDIVGEVREQGEPRLLVRSEALSAGDAIVTTQLPNAIEGLAVTTAD